MKEAKIILVTGAGGYLGTTLVSLLLQKGYQVRAVDRFFFGKSLLQDHARLTKITQDVRSLDNSIFNKVDIMIDLASISNDPLGELLPACTLKINYEARVKNALLAKNNGVKRYILPSSCSIYGFSDNIVDENSNPNPLTIYAESNLKAEEGVLNFADHSFCVTVLRQATLYGQSPRMRFDLVANTMIFSAYEYNKIIIDGDGSQWRPLLCVKDAARAILHMVREDTAKINSQIFNVGARNHQIKELAEIIRHIIPKQVSIESNQKVDFRSYYISFEKLKGLGFIAHADINLEIKTVWQNLQTETGIIDDLDKTITLKWYKNIIKWNNIINEVAINNRIF